MTTATTTSQRSYDLFSRTSKSSLFRLDRGVTLAADHIAWSINGRSDSAKLASIAALRLQTGGSWGHPVASCEIRFKDDFVLTVNSARPFETRADVQDALYRDFVRDLHRRLAAFDLTQVQCRAGYSERKFQVVVLLTFLLCLILIALPMVLFAITRELSMLGLFVFSVGFVWPLINMVGANVPQPYDLRQLPGDLLP